MTQPPRKVGKRLIGRYLFLRIVLATIVLTGAVVGSVFWAQALRPEDQTYDDYLPLLRSQAINTLDFGAISVTLSARFTYNSSIHPRIFQGNTFCWYSVVIVAVLQVAITYIPGLNLIVFGMASMGGMNWAITFIMMAAVFIVMEIEKAIRRSLKAQGADTDDTERWLFDKTAHPDQNIELPKGASHLNLTELNH